MNHFIQKALEIKKLKDLSNQTIHDSTTFQDQEAIEIAVLIYSLSKIYEKPKAVDASPPEAAVVIVSVLFLESSAKFGNI